jgi:hypothetical protein
MVLSDSMVLNSASGFFWMSTSMPILSNASFNSAATGSAVAAAPVLNAKLVLKPSGIPASTRNCFARARSVLNGIGCGKLESGGIPLQSAPHSRRPRSNNAALNMSSYGSAAATA